MFPADIRFTLSNGHQTINYYLIFATSYAKLYDDEYYDLTHDEVVMLVSGAKSVQVTYDRYNEKHLIIGKVIH